MSGHRARAPGHHGCLRLGWSGSRRSRGLLTVKVPTRTATSIARSCTRESGSVYHLTKTLDQLLFAFYCANDLLRITDLHQGIVWGTQTPQTRWTSDSSSVRLRRRLRHRAQPLLDAGRNRTRLRCTARAARPARSSTFVTRCVAFRSPRESAERGEKPMVSTRSPRHRVIELAEMIAKLTGAEIAMLPNRAAKPRKTSST